MFFECNSLELLDLTNVNFNNLIDFRFMLIGCENFKNLYLTLFKMENKKYNKMVHYYKSFSNR